MTKKRLTPSIFDYETISRHLDEHPEEIDFLHDLSKHLDRQMAAVICGTSAPRPLLHETLTLKKIEDAIKLLPPPPVMVSFESQLGRSIAESMRLDPEFLVPHENTLVGHKIVWAHPLIIWLSRWIKPFKRHTYQAWPLMERRPSPPRPWLMYESMLSLRYNSHGCGIVNLDMN